ncbi:hypothetical protein KIN20_010726 [Parelaphostrongylus tenuis]|uniref:Uncharacterized protein n=1 Tax=Parelaphostrongylus tenuis TaxID=148309 RepID=A0AAD5MSB5_PARTN|nr:hypothetical protein KIN20_010726 [Parelaphostrongylus tenuis]
MVMALKWLSRSWRGSQAYQHAKVACEWSSQWNSENWQDDIHVSSSYSAWTS